MIDFKLTNNGDIDIAQIYQFPVFTINFFMKQYPCLRIDFDTDVLKNKPDQKKFKINFRTNIKQNNDKISTVSIKDKNELAQEIIIRLKTELGEFSYIPTLGSQIILERHTDIRSELTLEKIKQYATEAISDLGLSTLEITIERIDDTSRYIYETLKIIIDTKETGKYIADV